MPELPGYMLKGGRPSDPEFSPGETLYRRVPPEYWDDDDIDLDSVSFPDVSVTREKYGPPESARWHFYEYRDWGIIGFLIKAIPRETRFQGAYIYRMKTSHEPTKINYPHCEIQVFEVAWDAPNAEVRLDEGTIQGVTRAAQQEWRELLRRGCSVIIRPGQVSDPEVIARYFGIPVQQKS
jgi:hypothetical protein